MLLIESQQALTRTKIQDICNRILSRIWREDGLCRLLSLRNDPNTSEAMRRVRGTGK